MLYWEAAEENPSAAEHLLEFARIWKALPKMVIRRSNWCDTALLNSNGTPRPAYKVLLNELN